MADYSELSGQSGTPIIERVLEKVEINTTTLKIRDLQRSYNASKARAQASILHCNALLAELADIKDDIGYGFTVPDLVVDPWE